jgi:hypothetical protein
MGAQEAGRVQVHPAAEEHGELVLEGEEAEARNVAFLELHEDVHVARRSEVVTESGAEEGEPADVVPAAELGEFFVRDLEGGARHRR